MATKLSINQVDVARLNVQRGEVLVVTVDRPITPETADRIKEAFKRAFESAGGVQPGVLIKDNSMTISVVRAEDA